MMEFLISKEFLTAVGIIITLIGYTAYTYTIFKGDTRPHPVSWFIFGLLTAIGFAAQLADGGGMGAYITGLSAVITLLIAALGYFRRASIHITRTDLIILVTCLAAIPLWIVTETPLYSVILITVIDALAFYPTFYKTWFDPKSELGFSYIIAGLKFVFSLAALEHFTIITALYPASLVFMNWLFLIMLYYRRWAIKNHGK